MVLYLPLAHNPFEAENPEEHLHFFDVASHSAFVTHSVFKAQSAPTAIITLHMKKKTIKERSYRNLKSPEFVLIRRNVYGFDRVIRFLESMSA